MKINEALIESEQTVLGSLLIDNDCFDQIEGLKAEAFYREDHRVIFTALVRFIEQNKPVDTILLAEQLQRQGDLERVGNLAYIGALVESVVSTRNVKAHAAKVINQWKLRRLKALLVELDGDVESRNPVEEILEKAESGMFDLLEGNGKSELSHIKEAVIEAVDWEDSEIKGVTTGLRDLDSKITCLANSEMIILGARPSMGNTSLAMQIAENVARKDPVIVFSLEMSKRQIGSRMLKFHEERVGKSQAIAHLSSLKLHIDDKPGITVQHIRSQCRKAKRKHGLSMIVVDYLQLMRGSGDNRSQEIGSISRGLKTLAKEFDCPVLVLSQLSREVEKRTNKRPMNSDLRDSGEIEQDADLVLFIYREEVYDSQTEDKGMAEIICSKNRNGSTGEVFAKFTGETTRFSDFNGQRTLKSVKQSRGFEQ